MRNFIDTGQSLFSMENKFAARQSSTSGASMAMTTGKFNAAPPVQATSIMIVGAHQENATEASWSHPS